ncbi:MULTISPECIES: hypothetical protein [unclassified Alcanivorax]|jgi:hypothetical protein|uniref:hypothetical protein n=1 Tax=unclassified Alcanivorax TaxID=2638842 RepID=UPI00089FDB06|nr:MULTISPECIES: hypothetical protein [unclassified Alcanivorax]MED5238989.1 hypothetical protein [Pseudomonadota bacterium]MEE3388314.1 hypothetical protein [Pseudomonadota bacterium]SEF72976.1 hypothetical protein SAMN04515663_1034 [Alcanivorax sp. DSM 26293]
MTLKRGVVIVGLFLAAGWLLVSCGMNSEEKRLAAAIDQALQTRDLGYWQVEDLDIEDQRMDQTGPEEIITYKVEAVLALDKSLREVRYVDDIGKRVVTRTALAEGEERDLTASVQIIRGNDEENVVTTLDEQALPRGMVAEDFERRFDGWQVIAEDSDEFADLEKELQGKLDDSLSALAEADHTLRQVQVQLMASRAELAVLEENAEAVGGLGEPMEKASQDVEALIERLEEQEATRDSLSEDVDRNKKALASLRGE